MYVFRTNRGCHDSITESLAEIARQIKELSERSNKVVQ